MSTYMKNAAQYKFMVINIFSNTLMKTSSNGNIFRVTGPCYIFQICAHTTINTYGLILQTRTTLGYAAPRSSRHHCIHHSAQSGNVPSKKMILMTVHDMMMSSKGNISASLALWAGNSPVTGEFPSQRPVTRSFDVFLDLRLNKVNK